MKNHNQRIERMLSMEILESRMPLAGDISVQVSGGNLFIKGDNAANNLAIEQTAVGEFTITGNDGEQFKVNGAAAIAGPVSVNGVTKDVKVDLKKGNDRLELTGLGLGVALAKSVEIKTGEGTDVVHVSAGSLSGKLFIDTHSGDKPTDGDEVDISAVAVAKTIAVNTGKGDDEVFLRGGTVAGNVFIKTGSESDEVVIENGQQFAKSLSIDTGDAKNGADIVRIQGASVVSAKLHVKTRAGDDLVVVNSATVGKAIIDTGAGNDTLNIAALDPVAVDQALISLGKGDDNVIVGVGTLTFVGPKKSKVQGGLGNDTITGNVNLSAGSLAFLVDPTKTGVETVL